MDITKQKGKVFSEIAALRVSAEGFPKSQLLNSLPSITQETNSLDFLMDLLKSLVGFESLKDSLVDALTHNLDDIEIEIKEALKKILKSMVSCSINPSIPSDFTNNGIILELEKIDFLNILKTAPTTQAGKLLYNDVNSGTQSTDFNTFLYNLIQDNGSTHSWGENTFEHNILNITFNPIAPNPSDPNNSIIVKPNGYYETEGKKLTDLNNDYIDSIKLFESSKLINNIIDIVFGSISVDINKDIRTLQNELKVEDIIDRIINSDIEDEIDNSYFSFSNSEILDIEYRSELRRKGLNLITTCENKPTSINIDTLTNLDNELTLLNTQSPSGELNELITTTVRNGIDELAEEAVENINAEDKLNVKLNFIEDMLKHLMTAIVNVILSPKLIVILAMNHMIIHGESFKSVQDFMEKNKALIDEVLSVVRDAIVSILMAKVLKEIKKIVADNLIKVQTEKIKNIKAQLSSLIGVPNDVLRKISGLTKR